jgi:ribosomal protein S18 acetylase RimI-like enzyme
MNKFILFVFICMTPIASANFSLIYKLSSQHRQELHHLYQQMWWTNTRTLADVDIILDHSYPIGLIDNETKKLIGFVRIVSDAFKYAFIFDVLIKETYRGQGLGRMLMEAAFNHPELQRVTVFELHCLPDKVAFYERFGFKEDFENVKALRVKRTITKK